MIETDVRRFPHGLTRTVAGVLLCIAAALAAPAGQAKAQTVAENEIVFVPPVFGAPGNRVGAGTRSTLDPEALVVAVAPKGGGMTATRSPVLYWWLARDTVGQLSLALRARGADRPLLELTRQVDLKKGFHGWSLADLGLRLTPEKVYEWSISLQATGDSFPESAASLIEYRAAESLAGTSSPDLETLAAKGVWYDTFAAVASEESTAARRDALLEQAKIRLPGR